MRFHTVWEYPLKAYLVAIWSLGSVRLTFKAWLARSSLRLCIVVTMANLSSDDRWSADDTPIAKKAMSQISARDNTETASQCHTVSDMAEDDMSTFQPGRQGVDTMSIDHVVQQWRAPLLESLRRGSLFRGRQLRPLRMSSRCMGANTFCRGLKVMAL